MRCSFLLSLRRMLMVNFSMFKEYVSECNMIAITVTVIILLVQQLTFFWSPCHYCDNYGCLMHHLGLLRFSCRHCLDFIDFSMSSWLSMSTLLSYNWCFYVIFVTIKYYNKAISRNCWLLLAASVLCSRRTLLQCVYWLRTLLKSITLSKGYNNTSMYHLCQIVFTLCVFTYKKEHCFIQIHVASIK